MNAWEILGIEPTKDKKEIKKGSSVPRVGKVS